MRPNTASGIAFLFLVAACSSSAKNDKSASGEGGASSAAQGSGASSGAGASGATGTASQGAGGAVDFAACSVPGQCVLSAPGCCGGTCGVQTLESVEPINTKFQDAFFASTCPDPDNAECPGCAAFPNGNLYAYCDGGHCQEGDVTTTTLGECAQPSDCVLRFGLGCCELCNGTWEPGMGGDLVAIAAGKLSELLSLVCAGDVACDECAPQYPPGAVATCEAGHCKVVQATDPGG